MKGKYSKVYIRRCNNTDQFTNYSFPFNQQIAYEYLCRLEEARVWISKCIDEELPPVGNGVLEDSLRNGVHLAKLAASISPHIVQVFTFSYFRHIQPFKSTEYFY